MTYARKSFILGKKWKNTGATLIQVLSQEKQKPNQICAVFILYLIAIATHNVSLFSNQIGTVGNNIQPFEYMSSRKKPSLYGSFLSA